MKLKILILKLCAFHGKVNQTTCFCNIKGMSCKKTFHRMTNTCGIEKAEIINTISDDLCFHKLCKCIFIVFTGYTDKLLQVNIGMCFVCFKT